MLLHTYGRLEDICNNRLVRGEDSKRNKAETPVPSEVNGDLNGSNDDRNGVDRSLEDVQPPTSNEYDHQREPDVFRCLSCFSIFMPTGNGFKFFRMFGNKSNQENNEHSQKEVPVKKHWFSNVFGSNKQEEKVADLNESRAVQSSDTENNAAGISISSSNLISSNDTTHLENSQLQSANLYIGTEETKPFSTQKESESAIKDNKERIIADSSFADTNEQLLSSYQTKSNNASEYPGMFVVKPPSNHVEVVENSISSLQYDGFKSFVIILEMKVQN